MIQIPTVDQLDLNGATVFYRVDYNVPLEDGKVSDATRIEETMPTILLLRERGAKIVMASHLGRPKGKPNDKYSLKPVREKLAEILKLDIAWADDCVGAEAKSKAQALKPAEVLLLENLRFHEGEEANDRAFAEQLRELADTYVNDAFGGSHRAHASIVALAELFPVERRAGGLLLAKEIDFLQKVTNVSERPFVAILGGAKIAGKIEALEAMIRLADTVLIGGGMANTFLAAKGAELGSSLVDKDSIDVANRILAAKEGATVHLPSDLVVTDSLDNPTKVRVVPISEPIASGEMAVDIGPKTLEEYTQILLGSKMVFWNGPMGVFEKEQFAAGTLGIAKAVADASAIVVVGGGESVEAVNQSGYAERISHISTGGGASLEFLSGSSLPGIEVLRKG